ncbi:hypothetical protein CBS101457_000104 [Exobasidium rhododendri]|nr:hypothetical protein CBS101457_000104 [Exobasidium rhododendri]
MTIKKKDFTVAIIGGGIGGLSAAIGLLRAGVHVEIFEAAAEFSEIGAGVSFGANARSALTRLGLGEEFEAEATTVPSGIWFEWRAGEGEEQELYATTYSKPLGNVSVHRAKFLQSIAKHVPLDICHFGERLRSISSLTTGQSRLHFESGNVHDTDIVIGYDGIHSKTRAHLDTLNGTPSKLQWSGTWAYRGLIPKATFVGAVGKMGKHYAEIPQMFCGKDAHILLFPIDKNETVNVVAFHTDRSRFPERPLMKGQEAWIQSSTKAEMISHFPGWGKDMISLMSCMENPKKWALHQLIPSIDSYIHGSICLAGDAAHGGTPHQGAMAGQAIEDGLFLSWLFAHPAVKKANIKEALEVYDAVRRPRANKVLETSLEAGDVYEMAGLSGSDRVKLKTELESRFDWIWEHDHESDFIAAEKEMRRRGMLSSGP